MGHIRIITILALIAAVATGCVADTADPMPFKLGTEPEDQLTCIVAANWDADSLSLPHSRANYPLLQCWTGGPEDMDSSPELRCARAHGEARYACVETRENGYPITGTWYAFEGGMVEQVKIPGASTSFQGPTDAFALVYTGPTFAEYDCDERRSELLEDGWCE